MFKCQPGYTLRKIKGINYLLPYGQQIADLKKGFVLNETSTFLWNVLQHHEGAEPQQLAEILARTYQLDESYYPELLKDVTDFLTQLTAMGMITEDLHLISSIPSVSMIIAGICIKLYGSAELISPNFKPFYHEFSDDDTSQEIELVTTPPPSRCYGQVLLQNSEMTVFENPDRYVVLFPQHKETDCLQSTQLLFSIREKHGCFPVIPEWENPHTLLCGMSFLTHRT